MASRHFLLLHLRAQAEMSVDKASEFGGCQGANKNRAKGSKLSLARQTGVRHRDGSHFTANINFLFQPNPNVVMLKPSQAAA